MSNFRELQLDDILLKKLKELSFKAPTKIQTFSIPAVLSGKNVIAKAPTGTGKTLAFVLPMLQFFIEKRLGKKNAKALILSPTRELVLQTNEVLKNLTKGSQLKIISLHGGQKLSEQKKLFEKGFDILNCAPGRLIDMANAGFVDLNDIAYSVIDEGDRLLELGFYDDMAFLLSKTPMNSQRLMFSATYSDTLKDLARNHIFQPEEISIELNEEDRLEITYYYVETNDENRFEALISLLSKKWIGVTLIFVKGKAVLNELSANLKETGINAECFHADMDVVERDSALRRFKKGLVEVLVCSDLAARGLDISGVRTVVNYHIPDTPELYVHRTGRTGRAQSKGFAYTLVVNEAEILQLKGYHRKGLSSKVNAYKQTQVTSQTVEPTESKVYYKMVTFNRGKKDQLTPGHFLGLLTKELEVPAEDIGNINIYDDKTEIEMKAGAANKSVTRTKTIKGKKLVASFREKEGKKYKNREIGTRTQLSSKQKERKKQKNLRKVK